MGIIRGGLFVGLVVATAAAGCSSNAGPSSKVSGVVRYKGELLKGGNVRFVYDQGQQYTAFIRPDGTYSLTDIPAGPVTVVVETSSISPEKAKATPKYKSAKADAAMDKRTADYDAAMGKGKEGPKEDREDLTRFYVKIPAKYEDAKTSDLKYTVESGTTTKDFDLTD